MAQENSLQHYFCVQLAVCVVAASADVEGGRMYESWRALGVKTTCAPARAGVSCGHYGRYRWPRSARVRRCTIVLADEGSRCRHSNDVDCVTGRAGDSRLGWGRRRTPNTVEQSSGRLKHSPVFPIQKRSAHPALLIGSRKRIKSAAEQARDVCGTVTAKVKANTRPRRARHSRGTTGMLR